MACGITACGGDDDDTTGDTGDLIAQCSELSTCCEALTDEAEQELCETAVDQNSVAACDAGAVLYCPDETTEEEESS